MAVTSETMNFGYIGKFPKSTRNQQRRSIKVPCTEKVGFGGGHQLAPQTMPATKPRTPQVGNSNFIMSKSGKQITVFAKLMSIASGLKKNILPKTHEHINQIYTQRLNKYLNLIATHGEDKQALVNKMFAGATSSD